jgi:hypothetical protein
VVIWLGLVKQTVAIQDKTIIKQINDKSNDINNIDVNIKKSL